MAPHHVVHISPTPLVGAPGKLARLLDRRPGWRSISLILNDYPNDLAGRFLADSIHWAGREADVLAERALRQATIVHIHNSLPPEAAERIYRFAPDARYVYQAHSPLREGPLFAPRADAIGLPFCEHLVVAQYHPRVFPNYRPILNVVDHPGSKPTPIERGERLRLLFSPSHTRDGRWNGKTCPELDGVLDSLQRLRLIECIRPSAPMNPNALFELRRTCHISIDEIVTGAFHQVSLEALAAGNAVINGADFFSLVMFREATGSAEFAPFVTMNPTNVAESLLAFVQNRSRVEQAQALASKFHAKYLTPAAQAERLTTLYSEILAR
jgi:hypothetical protein